MQGSIEAYQGQQCQQNCAETTSTVLPQSAPEGTFHIIKIQKEKVSNDLFS